MNAHTMPIAAAGPTGLDASALVDAIARRKARPVEPEERRTLQKVRRGSSYPGGERRTMIARHELEDLKKAAEVFAQSQHVKGKRRGHEDTISSAILHVLNALLDMTAKWGGNVRPSIATIMKWARVGRGSVCRAITILEEYGLLEHERKCERRDDAEPGRRGPQVRQVPSFYRVLTDPLRKLLPRISSPRVRQAALTEAEHQAARKRMAASLRKQAVDEDLERRMGPERWAQLQAKLARESGAAHPEATRIRSATSIPDPVSQSEE